MKTQTKVTIKGSDLQLHLDDNKLVTFKDIKSTKQIPEYMISNLNYLINSFSINNQVSIRVEKETFPFMGWYIYLENSNLLTCLRIYYRNDTKKSSIFGRVNGYLVDNQPTQTYKKVIKNLQKHVQFIF